MCTMIWKASFYLLAVLGVSFQYILNASDLITIVVTKQMYDVTIQLLFWNQMVSLLSLCSKLGLLKFIDRRWFFLCKCIYCWQNGFLSSVLVLQVLTARFGLIRPAAGSSPVCLKTDPRRKIDPRDLKQQDSRWERSTSFVFGIAYMSLCISAHMTQSNLIKWLLKRL